MPKQPISNGASDPDVAQRRTGGSDNDPHGGHEHPDNEYKRPNPDKAEETGHRIPPSGPHARPRLTDDDKTPNSGAMVDENSKEIDSGIR